MSKRILSESELQIKIDRFLTRKNRVISARSRDIKYSPLFDFKNDSVTFSFR